MKECGRLRPINDQVEELICKLMSETRERRQDWISQKLPDLTTILNKFPRFQDVQTLVSNLAKDQKYWILALNRSLFL